MVSPYVEEETVVGFGEEAMQLVDRLTGTKKRLEVITIVGMAGLGKTTLSRKVYNDPLIAYHFYVRAWTYVSQVYERRDTLLRLSTSITPLTLAREISEMSVERLSETLRKSLMGQRYLIVIDDIWDIGAWDDLKRSFPDNNNGSRILLTSRLKDVPFYAEPSSPPHCLNFLTEDASWALLQQKVFGKQGCCPMKLMDTGKRITAKCQGLPLAIVVVAGVLASAKMLDWWSQVAEDMHSHIARDQRKYMKTLSLSYKHMPNHHMRACFLYLGASPEDRKIPVQRLIWMWIAEGFIPYVGTKSLEDTASDYLEELINRSLVKLRHVAYMICSVIYA